MSGVQMSDSHLNSCIGQVQPNLFSKTEFRDFCGSAMSKCGHENVNEIYRMHGRCFEFRH